MTSEIQSGLTAHIPATDPGALGPGCILTISYDDRSFAYAVFDRQLSCQALRAMPCKLFERGGREELNDIFNSDQVLAAGYERTELVCNGSFALSPEPLSSMADMAILLKAAHKPQADPGSYHCSRLDAQHACLVWAGSRMTETYFAERLSHVRFRHPGEILIGTMQPALGSRTVYADISKETFYMVAFEGRELRFFNSFEYHSPEDFLYFMALAYEQMGFDMNVDSLVLLGHVEWNSGLVELTRKYVRNASMAKRPEALHFSERFSNIGQHKHYVLFAAALLSKVPA